MSDVDVEQEVIGDIFKRNYLIPDYQRPYAWEESHCQTLWNDLKEFIFPNGNFSDFNPKDSYFLGPIVTFENHDKKEVIDGQQRLTTLVLLLRAFYKKFEMITDGSVDEDKKNVERCIWNIKLDEKHDKIMNKADPKVVSEVATDDHKEEFIKILSDGEDLLDISKYPESKNKKRSKYAINYHYFINKVFEFYESNPEVFKLFPRHILENCYLLRIEAKSQESALRIFSTLNDRGKPLADADIFKAEFYKYFKNKGQDQKDEFIEKWKALEIKCRELFPKNKNASLDEIFARYMYYERAKLGISQSTTEGLRKFYEKDSYALLKKDETFENLLKLANFWEAVQNQDADIFSEPILKNLFILNYAPNGMWSYLISVYFMANKDENDSLDQKKFEAYLNKTIAFIWSYALVNPGANALRTPLYPEMIGIVNDNEGEFNNEKFDKTKLENILNEREFTGGQMTRSMLAWWAYQNENQELLSLETNFHIEHIFATKRYNKEKDKADRDGRTYYVDIESIGNKSFLEQKINITASDYSFEDKKDYYLHKEKISGQKGTKIEDLRKLAKKFDDFTDEQIKERKEQIISSFLTFVEDNGLMKEGASNNQTN